MNNEKCNNLQNFKGALAVVWLIGLECCPIPQRLWISSLVGECMGGNQSVFLSYIDVSLSLSLSLPFSLKPINIFIFLILKGNFLKVVKIVLIFISRGIQNGENTSKSSFFSGAGYC